VGFLKTNVMNWLEKLAQTVLFHGTLKSQVPEILREGLLPGEGCAGAGVCGVFLSNSMDGALHWAKYRFMTDRGEDSDRFDRRYGPQTGELLAV
jgi:hypothetical protein